MIFHRAKVGGGVAYSYLLSPLFLSFSISANTKKPKKILLGGLQ